MIIPDVNLLVHAYDSSSPHYAAAAEWWTACMTGNEEVGLPSVVIFGFVRICTHPKVFQNPMTITEAGQRVRLWLSRPQARVIDPSPHHVSDTLLLLENAGTGGNLTTDAQIAALVRQEKAVLHSNDTDFLRFPGLRWHNPITGKSGAS